MSESGRLKSNGEGRLSSNSDYGFVRSCGYFLVFSGLAHLVVWKISGEPWTGAVSWRKPALFGISGGLTLVSAGYLQAALHRRRGDRLLAITGTFAMCAEVGLITLQRWRGVASHFNRSTVVDAAIDTAMTLFITVFTLYATMLTVRCFVDLRAKRDMQLAWRSGFLFLIISCAIGFVILLHGIFQLQQGGNPELVGTAGVTKFPHGVVIHVLQILPVFVVILRKAGVPEDKRLQAVHWLNIAFLLLLTFAVLQTLAGRGRTDVNDITAAILGAALLCSIPCFYALSKNLLSSLAAGRLK